MYVYTVIITICKVGAIWARTIVFRKTFQSISTVVFMVMIIHINQIKSKSTLIYEEKRRKNNEVFSRSNSGS
jgi:hypothetical protein